MSRSTSTLFLIVTTLVLITICNVKALQATYYVIVPENNNSACNVSGLNTPCLTMQQFAMQLPNQPLSVELRIDFASGKHTFSGGIEINNTDTVFLTGQLDNSMNKSEITCNRKSCFYFYNTSIVHIQNLAFKECSSEDSDGGALFLSRIQTVNISQCLFANNYIRQHGGAMRLQLIESVHIKNTLFINNSAICKPFKFYINKITGKISCSPYCKTSSGAISSAYINSLVIIDCYFEHNKATCSGGAIAATTSNITLLRSRFTRSKTIAGSGGGLMVKFCTLRVVDTIFEQNQAPYGGGLMVISCTLRVFDTIFEQNQAVYGGGIFLSGSTADIWKNLFALNNANIDGGAIRSENTTLSIEDSFFTANRADYFGGTIYLISVGKVTFISNSTFLASSSLIGGALAIRLGGEIDCSSPCINEISPTGNETHLTIINSTFISNQGKTSGGSIDAIGGIVEILNSEFINNTCQLGGSISSCNNFIVFQEKRFISNIGESGGALYIGNGSAQSFHSKFSNNEGTSGGAVYVIFGTLVIQNDEYTGNKATVGFGGAVWALNSLMKTTGCTYLNNSAKSYGGAVYVYRGSYTSKECIYNNNYSRQISSALSLSASFVYLTGDFLVRNYNPLLEEPENQNNNAVLHLINANGTCTNLIFDRNIGSMYLFFSTLNFTGLTVFTDNSGITGGALTLVQSTVYFDKSCQIFITNNSAIYGGGIFLSQSELRVNTQYVNIDHNTALLSGGGIFGYQSQILINADQILNSIVLKRNIATEGGALFCTATSLSIFSGLVVFISNQAMRGGAVTLSENSKIYIQKTRTDLWDDLSIKLLFTNNTAEYGGAIYEVDRSNSGVLCEQTSRNTPGQLTTNECFIQTLQLYFSSIGDKSGYNHINIFFQFNKGTRSGNDIYGGLLDRCQLNTFSEIFKFGFSDKLTGFDYLKTIAQFQIDFNYSLVSSHSFNLQLLTNITGEHMKELISSDAVKLCFCTGITYDCSFHLPIISVGRGKPFSIRVVTVDQVENPVSGIVLANVVSNGTRLKVGQARQFTREECTELTYNVFSTKAVAVFEVYPDGPCNNAGVSSKKVVINFLPCHCPNGLQPAPLENECKCECGSFASIYASNCQLINSRKKFIITVVRRTERFWIQYSNYINVSDFQFQSCPYDYCVDKPGNLSISLPLGVDKQCAFNRTGIMCGECEDGLSLVFSSSRCLQCSDHYIALMIVFAFAGVALVAFILIFNITVGVGTIHGLILYTNIVGANSSVFLPPETALKTFVSWVNLDLGIETCFYNGMDSSAKVLLQIVFPLYTISLSAMIIVLSNYWGRFARLIGGRKNPVSTLCTLFLLSYSKLLRTTIASLQFTSLSYPDGSAKFLWLYNPNIPYLTASRVPFFVISILTIAFGTVYTVLLFFGQWIRKSRNVKLLRCFHSIKYNAFIDAYNGPFVLNCHFWIGILLITRIIHHTLSSLLNESAHLLIVTCLLSMLLTLKQLLSKIYRNWWISFIETSFFVNLLLFSTSTYYISTIDGDQVAVANASVSIAFITFIGIALYHFHTYWLNSLNIYQKLMSAGKRRSRQTLTRNIPLTTFNTAKAATSNTTSQHKDINLLREPLLEVISTLPKPANIPPERTQAANLKPTSTTVIVDRKLCTSFTDTK